MPVWGLESFQGRCHVPERIDPSARIVDLDSRSGLNLGFFDIWFACSGRNLDRFRKRGFPAYNFPNRAIVHLDNRVRFGLQITNVRDEEDLSKVLGQLLTQKR